MNIAILLASGLGKRMGDTPKPKQFLEVEGIPLMIYPLLTFQNHPSIDKIIITSTKDYLDEVKSLCKKYQLSKVDMVLVGGETRQVSVFKGLEYLFNRGVLEDDIILIHDTARPLLSGDIITDNINSCKKFDSVSTAIKTNDTIFHSLDGNIVNNIINRDEVYNVQTPQTFKFKIIYNAHKLAYKKKKIQSTDDCSLILKDGGKVHLVNGSRNNFKITTIEDLKLFESIIKMNNKK